MAEIVTFGTTSTADLGVLVSGVDIGPATIKRRTLDLQGGDGVLDQSAGLGRVLYNERTITVTLKQLPTDPLNWKARRRIIESKLSGFWGKIVISDDPGHYWIGRVDVTGHERDSRLGISTIECYVNPWAMKVEETVYTITGSGSVNLPNERRPSVPVVSCSKANTTVAMGDTSVVLDAGDHTVLAFELPEGGATLTVTADADAVTTFTYREGAL